MNRQKSLCGTKMCARAILIAAVLLFGQATTAAAEPAISKQRSDTVAPSFAFASPSPTTKSAEEERRSLKEVIFGVPSLGLTSFAIQIASEKGFFAQRYIKATVVSARSSVIMAALVSGNMHFSNSTGSATRAALQGLPVRVIAYFQTEPFSLVVRPEINSIGDLKGKTIGLAELTSNNGVYLAHALELGNLSLRDVKHLAMTDDGRVQGLLAKQIDGAITSPPRTQQLLAQGMRLLTGPEISDIPSNGLVTTSKVLEKEPELANAILEALIDAILWTRANPENAISYFVAKYRLPAGIAAAAYKEQMDVLRWTISDAQLQKAIRVALQATGISQRTQISDAVDLSKFREIVRRRGLGN